MKKTFIILFASKSSGSSAIQNYIEANFGAQLFSHVPHHENETLYWTKAASILGIPQGSMHRSAVPYSAKDAWGSLQSFLKANGIHPKKQYPTKEELFEYYFTLTGRAMVVFEKSPHHLFNNSNIDLILEFAAYIKDRATVHLIGLVRDPQDTVYSAWDRWRFNCVRFEREWLQSYANLIHLQTRDSSLCVLKYETIVKDASALDTFLTTKCGLTKTAETFRFKNSSITRRKLNPQYLHSPDEATYGIARQFGYSVDGSGRRADLWWILSEAYYSLKHKGSRMKRKLRKLFG